MTKTNKFHLVLWTSLALVCFSGGCLSPNQDKNKKAEKVVNVASNKVDVADAKLKVSTEKSLEQARENNTGIVRVMAVPATATNNPYLAESHYAYELACLNEIILGSPQNPLPVEKWVANLKEAYEEKTKAVESGNAKALQAANARISKADKDLDVQKSETVAVRKELDATKLELAKTKDELSAAKTKALGLEKENAIAGAGLLDALFRVGLLFKIIVGMFVLAVLAFIADKILKAIFPAYALGSTAVNMVKGGQAFKAAVNEIEGIGVDIKNKIGDTFNNAMERYHDHKASDNIDKLKSNNDSVKKAK